jgi:cell division protein FtsZ
MKDANRIVLVAGLGGGTGTGAAPVIVEIAHSLGIEVIVAASLPVGFEGRRRKKLALIALEELKASGATILVHDNEATCQEPTSKQLSLAAFFSLCNEHVTAKVIRFSQAT